MPESLPLPDLLINLIDNERWGQLSDYIIWSAIPILNGIPMYLIEDIAGMHGKELDYTFDDAGLTDRFRTYRGLQASQNDLPWLDIELARVIMTSRIPGDDNYVVLDYRTDVSTPRVLASDWTSDGLMWVQVFPSFEDLAVA